MLSEYIRGLRFNDCPPIEWEEIKMDEILELQRAAFITDNYDKLFAAKSYKQFIDENPCILQYYHGNNGEEAFYALRTGYIISGIKPSFVAKLNQVFRANNYCCNVIPDKLGKSLEEKVCSRGFFKHGVTLEQAIQIICDKQYKVLENDLDVMYGTLYDEVLINGKVHTFEKYMLQRFPIDCWKLEDGKLTINGFSLDTAKRICIENM